MKAKKSLGQNFLKDLNILSKIVEQGKISEKDINANISIGDVITHNTNIKSHLLKLIK